MILLPIIRTITVNTFTFQIALQLVHYGVTEACGGGTGLGRLCGAGEALRTMEG